MLDTIVVGGRTKPRKPPSSAASAGRSARSDIQAATILIIEDDAIIAMAVAEELREHGFEVIGQADNGPDAIALAQTHRPDLIIADVRLRGEMNGIVAARHIKETQPTRIVFASAHIDVATRGAMEAVGYDAIVPKPYTPEQLVRVIRGALASGGGGD